MALHRYSDDASKVAIPKWAAGRWYSYGGTTGSTSLSATGVTRCRPLVVPAPVTIDAMAAECTVIPTDADVVYRFGIWADDGTNSPTTLRFSSGASSAITTLDFYSVAFTAFALSAGLWWVAAVLQHSGGGSTAFVTTNPSSRTISSESTPFASSTSLTSNSSNLGTGYSLQTNNGTLADAVVSTSSNASMPRVWVHCASLL